MEDSAIGLLWLVLLALSLWTVIIAVLMNGESRKKVMRWLGRRPGVRDTPSVQPNAHPHIHPT